MARIDMRSIIAMPGEMVKGQAGRCSDLTNVVIFEQRLQLSAPARQRHPVGKRCLTAVCP
jgi:hypothetical protein